MTTTPALTDDLPPLPPSAFPAFAPTVFPPLPAAAVPAVFNGIATTCQAFYTADQMRAYARAALTAAPSVQTAQPVAWRYQDSNGNYRYRGFVEGFDREYAILKPIPLYTHPAPASVDRMPEQPAGEAREVDIRADRILERVHALCEAWGHGDASDVGRRTEEVEEAVNALAALAERPATPAGEADIEFRLRIARLLSELHGEEVLSEQQCARYMRIDLVSWRRLERCFGGACFVEGEGDDFPAEDSETILRAALRTTTNGARHE